MKRRPNGDGSIFKRKDGRWSAQIYVTLVNGERKRICYSSKDYESVRKKLRETVTQENKHVPYSEKEWTVAEYLDYWMQDIQPSRVRETTINSYEMMIRVHIKPTLGNRKLRELSVYDVRRALDVLKKRGCSGRTGQKYLQILSACLNNAMREELIFRNVAQLVEKPKHTPKETRIWTLEQAALFLGKIKDHPQRIAFLLLLTYGMRRGEVLGLRWSDIDFAHGKIYVRQQIDRVNGKLMARDVKTVNSNRVLPLMDNVRIALLDHAKKNGITIPSFSLSSGLSTDGTVVVSEVMTPLEPRNLMRCFNILLQRTGLPRIKIHAMRHTAATALKDLNVPIKDVQLILGHSSIMTTLNIYQHGTPEAHRTAIAAIEKGLSLKQYEWQKLKSDSNFDSSYAERDPNLLSGGVRVTEVV